MGAGMKRKTGPEKVMMSDAEALTNITKYMEAQNRPFSAQNMVDNLSGRIRINQAKTLMDQLADSSILTCKEYGKAKVYIIN